MNAQHLLRCVSVEFPVKPENEIGRRRLRDGELRPGVQFGLQAHMRRRLDLQVAAVAILVELPGKGTLDVTRPCVMSFDEVAVIAVHDAYERGQIAGRARMKRRAQFCRGRCKLRNHVGESLGHLFETRRLDAIDAFDRRFFGRFSSHNNYMI
jgi:hypothetical protein